MDKALLKKKLDAIKATVAAMMAQVGDIERELAYSYEEDIVIVEEDFLDKAKCTDPLYVIPVPTPPALPRVLPRVLPSLRDEIMKGLEEALHG
jgi:hypothetical protein